MLSHEEYKNTRRKLSFKKGTNTPITIKEIRDFENKNKIKIPEQYKEFLLENNGSEPVINQIEFELNDGKSDNVFFIRFLVALQNSEIGKDEDNYDEESGTVKPPKGFMNIAYLDGDHPELFICIEEGNNFGKIFYCEDRDPNYIELIRDNFNELIENILPYFNYEFEEYCYSGDIEKAKELIVNGYKYPENHYNTLLYDAIKSDYDMTEIIKLLIQKEENISILKSILFKLPRTEELLDLLLNKGININELNEKGNTLLVELIPFYNYIIKESEFEKKLSLIKFLLERGTNINIKNKNNQDIYEIIKISKEDQKFKKYQFRKEFYNRIEAFIRNYK